VSRVPFLLKVLLLHFGITYNHGRSYLL